MLFRMIGSRCCHVTFVPSKVYVSLSVGLAQNGLQGSIEESEMLNLMLFLIDFDMVSGSVVILDAREGQGAHLITWRRECWSLFYWDDKAR